MAACSQVWGEIMADSLKMLSIAKQLEDLIAPNVHSSGFIQNHHLKILCKLLYYGTLLWVILT